MNFNQIKSNIELLRNQIEIGVGKHDLIKLVDTLEENVLDVEQEGEYYG